MWHTQTDKTFDLFAKMAHILEKLEGEAVDCVPIRRLMNNNAEEVINIVKIYILYQLLYITDAWYPCLIREALWILCKNYLRVEMN